VWVLVVAGASLFPMATPKGGTSGLTWVKPLSNEVYDGIVLVLSGTIPESDLKKRRSLLSPTQQSISSSYKKYALSTLTVGTLQYDCGCLY
jgi:hypothetical protein